MPDWHPAKRKIHWRNHRVVVIVTSMLRNSSQLDSPGEPCVGVAPAGIVLCAWDQSDPREPAGRRWSVLHVKARQEKAVAAVLAGVGIPYFLPLVTNVKFYGHRRRVVQATLFPSYVFVRGTIEEAFFAVSTKRVARVIAVADQGRMERDIRQIRGVLERGGALDLCPFLKQGMPVRVIAGPFKGVEGLVEERRGWDRMILQVHTLGRAASLEIDASLLERVG